MKRWIRRLSLILFWLGAGAVLAGILGFVLGRTEHAVLPFVLGLIAVTAIGPMTLLLSARTASGEGLGALLKMRPEEPPGPEAPRELARIESLREMGVTVRNFHHLYEFTVTAFSNEGAPRLEVFAQLITMGQLPNFFTGRYVVLAILPAAEPGLAARLRLDPEPSAEWTEYLRAAPERFDAIPAPPRDPVAPRAHESPSTHVARTARTVDVRAGGHKKMGPGRLALNFMIVASCAAIGFAVSIAAVFGGADRAAIAVSEVPKRLAGTVHGTWDSAVLDRDLRDLRVELAGRKIESIAVFDDSYSIRAVSETDPSGEDVYRFAGGSLSLSWGSTVSDAGTFSIDEVRAGPIHSAVAQVYAKDPEASIQNLFIRKLQGRLVIDVDVEGVYETKTHVFDARTGKPVAE